MSYLCIVIHDNATLFFFLVGVSHLCIVLEYDGASNPLSSDYTGDNYECIDVINGTVLLDCSRGML